MDPLSLIIAFIGILVAVIFGYFQIVVTFVKGEVRLTRRWPFVEGAEDPSTRDKSAAKEVVEILSKNIGVSIGSGEDLSLPDKIPTMVGRAAQEALMGDILKTVAEGRARLLCVTGEPGMGKTTLTEEFLRTLHLEKQSCLVARGRCSERLAGTEAYLPFLEALESMMRNDFAGQIAQIMKRLAPTWFSSQQICPGSKGPLRLPRMATDE